MMKYYMAGIKGAGMSALALFLSDLGYEVIGYDDAKERRFTEDRLVARGIKIYNEINEELNTNCIVIYSPALRRDVHPVLKLADELGLRIYEYQEMLGRLTKMFKTYSISGCHGKTTTTAMLSHILIDNGGCNYIIGDGMGHGDRTSNKFILESCEYRRHFLAYDPEYVVITNIELDHIDYYKSMDDMVLAYQQFANKANKMVIACGDDRYTHLLDVKKPIYFYGINEDNDIVAKNIEYRNDGTSFDVFIEEDYYGHFDLPLFGKHMLLNALAVIGICFYERIDAKNVAKSLKTFKGADRRFKEKILGDIVTIDDYAHHPTEVKVTIKGAKQKYPDKKIIAILKTHTKSRTKEFAQEFADALNLADKAYVMDINQDRYEEGYDDVTPDVIISKLKNGGYMSLDKVDELLEYKNAVLLFMSSKEIYELQDLYEQKLKEQGRI